jgi:hypothetical protein
VIGGNGMRKFALIFRFLCAVSLPGFSETYTIKFGDLPGGLEIKYEVRARLSLNGERYFLQGGSHDYTQADSGDGRRSSSLVSSEIR